MAKKDKSTNDSNDKSEYVLSDKEKEALVDFMQYYIIQSIKTLDDSFEGCSEDEKQEYFNEDLMKTCVLYYTLTHGNNTISQEDIKDVTLMLDFGVFDVIRSDPDIDNIVWLYNILDIWHKLAGHTDYYKEIS